MDPMYGMTGSASGAGTGAITSHRGVDLGPLRYARQTRQSHPIERIAPLSASQVPWQIPELATGPPVRYGSGARFGSRERERNRTGRRAHSTPNFVQAEPGGPQTRQEWIDALNSFDSRVAALEQSLINHTSLISKTNDNLIEKHGRINDLSTTVSENAEKIEQVRRHLEEACLNISTRYATVDSTELAIAQVIGQLDSLRSELMENVQSQLRPPATFPIHTPDDPTSRNEQTQNRNEQPHIGDAHGAGPGGQPMWNSQLPQPAFPHQPANARPQSPLRTSEQPYVAPPAAADHPRAQAMSDGVTDHAGCIHSPPGMAQSMPRAPPTSWTRQDGAPTPPWQGGAGGPQHHQQYHRQYQHFQSPPARGGGGGGFPSQGPVLPEFQGHNRVQYMGNREAMDKKSESLKKFSGNPGDFVNWANRFIDHMGRVQWDWKNTLEWLATTPENLSYARLSNEVMGPWSEPASDLARKLEQTIMDYMPEKVYNRRQQLCGGPTQRDNGFILWRNLHKENVGERHIMEDAGAECLRTYGQCTVHSELSAHLDGWYELLDNYCPELRECPHMLRSLFLGIIPKDLKTKILEDPHLQGADHRTLAEWCKARSLIQQREHLQDIAGKNMRKQYSGSLKALQQVEGPATGSDESVPPPPPPWVDTITSAILAAVRPGTSPKKERGRPERKNTADKRQASRSSSRNRRFLEGWGRRCNHCGSDKHLKNQCKEFEDMMRKNNVGKEKKDWKPPVGYKSALGRARDAAKASEDKKKKVAALESNEDSASDDDDCDFGSEHGGSFKVNALRRSALPRVTPKPLPICTVNRFKGLEFMGLDNQQECDPAVLSTLNEWAHKVRVASKKPSKTKLDRTANYINGHKRPESSTPSTSSGPRTDKETDVIVRQIQSTAPSKASSVRAARKIGSWNLEEGEMIALVDTGSFTHAIDAETELPDHAIEACDPDAPGTSAETAGGGILKKLGVVKTKGLIDDSEVEITWDHMKVSTPILSVRKLVKDGNDVYINKNGGYITHLASGKKMRIFNFQGVYYLRMKVISGSSTSPPHESDFHRPGP